MFRVVILVLSALLAMYIIYTVWSTMLPDNRREGLDTAAPATRITNVLSKQAQLPLVEYCIKAAHNAAYDGTTVSMEALLSAVQRGCRFLDFELFFVKDEVVVGVSYDPKYKILQCKNTLAFSKIAQKIMTLMNSSSAPNPKDPLFLNLRVKTNCDDGNAASQKKCNVYSKLAAALAVLTPLLYKGPVTGNTVLSTLVGKIVLCMDVQLAPDYITHAPILTDLINIETGNTQWTAYNYSDFLSMTPNVLTVSADMPMMAEPQNGVLTLQLARPDAKNVNNPEAPLSWVRTFGCQTICIQLYKKDAGLKSYEAVFEYYKTAFVPVGFVVNYVAGGRK
jgi:hypothetical protein